MYFRTILIPVDFTISTDVAIQKTLSLWTDPGISVHLVHVPRKELFNVDRFSSFFSGTSLQEQIYSERAAREKMDQLVMAARDTRSDISFYGWIINGAVEKVISEKAKEVNADLIVIGKKSHHTWFPFLHTVAPGRLAKKTETPVLTVKPGAINHPIRTVVLPVGDQFPEKKMAVISALRKKSWIQIRLVTFSPGDNTSDVLPLSLLNAYRRLKTNLDNDVCCKVLRGANKVKAILKYCEEVDADLLIVNPESETRIGWPNKHISDVLPVKSKTQVLAICP